MMICGGSNLFLVYNSMMLLIEQKRVWYIATAVQLMHTHWWYKYHTELLWNGLIVFGCVESVAEQC